MTLIELMVSLGVVAILAAIAIPNIAQFNGQLKATSDSRLFATHFAAWRSEAVRRREPILVTFTDASGYDPVRFEADLDGDNVSDEVIELSRTTALFTNGSAGIPADILINGLGIAPDINSAGLELSFRNGGEASELTVYRTGIVTFN